MSKARAIVIKGKDNVATATSSISSGTDVVLNVKGERLEIKLLQDIPFGHKFSIRNIEKNEKIIKYGEAIGMASKNIEAGKHVHVHNLKPIRGRGDLNTK